MFSINTSATPIRVATRGQEPPPHTSVGRFARARPNTVPAATRIVVVAGLCRLVNRGSPNPDGVLFHTSGAGKMASRRVGEKRRGNRKKSSSSSSAHGDGGGLVRSRPVPRNQHYVRARMLTGNGVWFFFFTSPPACIQTIFYHNRYYYYYYYRFYINYYIIVGACMCRRRRRRPYPVKQRVSGPAAVTPHAVRRVSGAAGQICRD